MRRRLLAVVLSAVCVLLVAACGAAGSETAAPTEEVAKEEAEAAQEADTQDTETAEDAESAETEASEREETEASETVEEPEVSPVIWRMDEEGIKNEEFGVTLSRDNGILEKLSLKQSMMVFYENDGISPIQEFNCNYYAGDLDDYITENEGSEKGMLGNECVYAYQIYKNNDIKFAFVENGIILSMYVSFNTVAEPDENVDINDYLAAANLQPCKEFTQDCLAYITEEGLYCPALGVAVIYEEGKNEINGQYAWLSSETEDFKFLQLSSSRGGGSAQEIVDSYAKNNVNDNTEELDGTVETTIAGYQYLGRGVIYHDPWADEDNREKWKFVSDDVKWSIDFWCTEEEGYETYLSIIEQLP